MAKILKVIRKPKTLLLYVLRFKIFRLIPDDLYLKIKYRLILGSKLNLENPRTFNEKLQWLKLYDRNPKYTQLVDKYEVRRHISDILGEKYLIPLLGVYNTFDEIDFDMLPDKFVLKPNHTSGNVYICKDKSKINYVKLKKEVDMWLKREYYWGQREWPYKDIRPRILCESYLSDEYQQSSITDYKIYCFNGQPKYCQVIRGRNINETIDFYDNNWNLMPFTGLRPLPNSDKAFLKPNKYNLMLKLARILSEGIPFVRVDFYYLNEKIIFGELTFYPQSGFGNFDPLEWNTKMGGLLKLPTDNLYVNK